jgi:hypothetical protein
MFMSFLQPFDHRVNDFCMLNIYAFYSRVFTLTTVAHHEEKSHFHGASFRHRQK